MRACILQSQIGGEETFTDIQRGDQSPGCPTCLSEGIRSCRVPLTCLAHIHPFHCPRNPDGKGKRTAKVAKQTEEESREDRRLKHRSSPQLPKRSIKIARSSGWHSSTERGRRFSKG